MPTTKTPSALDLKVRKRFARRGISGPNDLVQALEQVGHHTDASQASRWLKRSITPRRAAMQALAQTLDLPATDLAAWFMEGAA